MVATEMNLTTVNSANIVTVEDGNQTSNSLQQFAENFLKPYPYIVLVVCVIGIILNVINMKLLTHAKLWNTVTLLLTMVSGCELSLLIIIIPYVVLQRMYTKTSIYSIHTARFRLFYADASIFLHLSATWLIITTAGFRFIFTQFPLHSLKYSSKRAAKLAGVCTILVCLLVCVPNIILNRIVSFTDLDNNQTYYLVKSVNQPIENFSQIAYWLITIFGKLLPPILLLILTVFLVRILHRKRDHLVAAASQSNPASNKQTSQMLLAVVVLFFIVEFPQGLLLVYTLISKDNDTYFYFGDLIDLVTVISFSLNLILNASMSSQYRWLFVKMFKQKTALRAGDEKNGRASTGVNRTLSTSLIDKNPPQKLADTEDGAEEI